MYSTLCLQTLVACALLFAGSAQAHKADHLGQAALPAGLLENKTIELPQAGGEVSLSLNKGQAQGGLIVVRVKKSGLVVIKVQSNSTDELHLHGYDLRVAVSSASVGELRFPALKTGRFEMESHTTHKPVLILEVRP